MTFGALESSAISQLLRQPPFLSKMRVTIIIYVVVGSILVELELLCPTIIRDGVHNEYYVFL